MIFKRININILNCATKHLLQYTVTVRLSDHYYCLVISWLLTIVVPGIRILLVFRLWRCLVSLLTRFIGNWNSAKLNTPLQCMAIMFMGRPMITVLQPRCNNFLECRLILIQRNQLSCARLLFYVNGVFKPSYLQSAILNFEIVVKLIYQNFLILKWRGNVWRWKNIAQLDDGELS